MKKEEPKPLPCQRCREDAAVVAPILDWNGKQTTKTARLCGACAGSLRLLRAIGVARPLQESDWVDYAKEVEESRTIQVVRRRQGHDFVREKKVAR